MRTDAAAIALVVVALGCTRHTPAERGSGLRGSPPAPPGATPANDDAGSAGDAGDAGERAPLRGFPEQLELADEHGKLGFVSVPLGAREPRPIMIAIHGGSDKPERACAAWRGITEAYPFVVCPRGWGGNESRLGWRKVADTSERIARALAATKKTFASWIMDTRSMVLAGFSMGGSQVALLAGSEPQTYRRIAVGDSAHDPQPALTFSRAWVAGGGERAIFLCTTSGCEPALRSASRNVATHRALARLNIAPTQVHGLSERVVQSMRRDWPWLVAGAEGWETYAPPSDPALPGKTETFPPN